MDFRRSSAESLDHNAAQKPVFGRQESRYSVTSEEGSIRSIHNPSDSSRNLSYPDDDISVRTSQTSIDTFGTNPNLDKSTTPRKTNLTPSSALASTSRSSSHGSAGIELNSLNKKENGQSFTPLLMSQETFDNHRVSTHQRQQRSSVRASLRTTNAGEDLEISAPTLLARASATGALHSPNVNFVDDMDECYKEKKKEGKKIETSKDFLMATRSRILSINSRRYEGSVIVTGRNGIISVHEGVILPDRFWWKVRKTIMDWTLLAIAIFVPFAVSFDEGTLDHGVYWLVSSVTVNIIFITDLVLEFYTAFYDEEMNLVVDKKVIASHYLKHWFAIDLLTCFPVMLFATNDSSIQHFRRVVGFSIATKLLKALKYEMVWQEHIHRQFMTSRLLRAIRVSAYILILLHWGSCFWHLMGTDDSLDDDTPTWIKDGQLTEATAKQRYVASLYWCVATLTSVGYGDYTAQNEEEQIFNIFVMLIGCVGYAFCIGATSSFIANFNVRKKQKAKLLNQLENFMEDASLPPQLREKCRNATTVAAHHISLENRARQCMNNLPNSLRTEIQLFMHRKVIRDIKFLRTIVDVHPLFVAKCASMMQIPMKVRLGELIVQEGSSSEDMYFLVKGTVIAVRQGFPIMEMHHGDFFGELGCLLGSTRSSSVYALSDCELYTLSADALKQLNRKFPHIIIELKKIAKNRRSAGEQMQKHKKAIASAIATATRQHAHSIDAFERLSDSDLLTKEQKEKLEKKRKSVLFGEEGERLNKLEKDVAKILGLLEAKLTGTKEEEEEGEVMEKVKEVKEEEPE